MFLIYECWLSFLWRRSMASEPKDVCRDAGSWGNDVLGKLSSAEQSGDQYVQEEPKTRRTTFLLWVGQRTRDAPWLKLFAVLHRTLDLVSGKVVTPRQWSAYLWHIICSFSLARHPYRCSWEFPYSNFNFPLVTCRDGCSLSRFHSAMPLFLSSDHDLNAAVFFSVENQRCLTLISQ